MQVPAHLWKPETVLVVGLLAARAGDYRPPRLGPTQAIERLEHNRQKESPRKGAKVRRRLMLGPVNEIGFFSYHAQTEPLDGARCDGMGVSCITSTSRVPTHACRRAAGSIAACIAWTPVAGTMTSSFDSISNSAF
jgi:hypothetical protein